MSVRCRLCPFQNSYDQLKHTDTYSGYRGLPPHFPFRSKLLSQILVKEEPLETLPHSETIKVPKLALQQSSRGIRKSWLFMDGKDRGHWKNPGQTHGLGVGVSWHGEQPRSQSASRLQLASTGEGPSLSPYKAKDSEAPLAPMRQPVCWGFMAPEAAWGNAARGIPAKPIHHGLKQVTKILGKGLVCSPGKRRLEHSKHRWAWLEEQNRFSMGFSKDLEPYQEKLLLLYKPLITKEIVGDINSVVRLCRNRKYTEAHTHLKTHKRDSA